MEKRLFDQQARRLLATNYVWKERGNYRTDAEELIPWMRLLDEQQNEMSETTSLPALQGLLERRKVKLAESWRMS